MKTAGIIALVVVAAAAAFMMGSSMGYAGMLIVLMMGVVLTVVGPITLGTIAVAAGIFALSAKASGTKPNWKFFGKLSLAGIGVGLLVAALITHNAISSGFRGF